MVNVGGPSKGCMTCIRRKIKCSRERPSCVQCQKAKRTCEGYRDAADIMFRDQSQEVVAKARRTSRKQPLTSDDSSGSESIRTSGAVTTAPVLPRSPKLDKDLALIDFFANNFTDGNSIGLRNNLFWIPPNFTEFLKEDSVKLSVQSTGAMALARLQKSPEYFQEAHSKYSAALLSLAEMWQREAPLRKESASLTAIFLGFFEILASYNHSSRQSWRIHLAGISALYDQVGHEDLRTDFDARMFRQTRSQVIIYALQSHTSVPPSFAVPRRCDVCEVQPHFKPFDDADALLILLADIQAKVRGPKSPNHQAGRRELISELKGLDAACCSWMDTLPPSWSFSRQDCSPQPGWWWASRYDIYLSGFLAHTWNKVRAVRFAVHDMVQELQAQPLSVVGSPDLEDRDFIREISPLEIQGVVTDMCATIPLYYRPFSAKESSEKCDPPLLGTVFWFLWPLEVLSSMREAPAELTSWIVYCCEQMFETTGIVKAQLVAQRLRLGYNGPILP